MTTVDEKDEDFNNVCNCYPEHCTDGKHDKCWCNPEVVVMENGNNVIIHNDFN